MLNKSQIETIETRLMGIITNPDSWVDDIKEAIRSLGYVQKLQQLIKPAEPCCKEEEKCAENYRSCAVPDVVVAAMKDVPDLDYEEPKRCFVDIEKDRIKPLTLLDCKKSVYLSTGDTYILSLSVGNNNGNGAWRGYLLQLISLLSYFHTHAYDAWIISIKNDCLDDTFYCEIGIQHK